MILGACSSFPNIPPLYEVETDLPGGATVTRALFGLYEDEETPESRIRVVRPLGMVENTGDGRQDQILPPFYLRTKDGVHEERYIAPFFYQSSWGTETQRQADESDDDVSIFPFAFWGEEPGEGPYFLLFPLYGELKGKLLADEIRLRGFPLYADTRTSGWQSKHVLWPLIAWGEGDDRSHFRVLPFWSESDNETSSRRSALWPFIHWNTQQQGDRELSGWFVFPFVGRRTADDGSSRQTTVLYPLFQFASDDKTGDEYTGILWPFYKRSVRPGDSESTCWWPFWGNYEGQNEESTFWAWPIVWHQWEVQAGVSRVRDFVVPFWMRSESGPPGGAPTKTTLKSWPLFASESHADGRSTLRVPGLIPVLGWEAGERVYSDLISLFRSRTDAEGREAWDGPLGLVRYRKGSSGERKLTLFWWLDIPLGGDEDAAGEGGSGE